MQTNRYLIFTKNKRTELFYRAGKITAGLYLELGVFEGWKFEYITEVIENLPDAVSGDQSAIDTVTFLLKDLGAYARSENDIDLLDKVISTQDLVAEARDLEYGSKTTPTQTAT